MMARRLARPPSLAALATAPLLLAALAAAPLLLSGCAAVNELARSAFKPPTVTFQAVAVQAIDFDGATLAVDFQLQNPNGFGLRLARVAYWLKLEERVVARGDMPGGLAIPAAGAAPLRFTVRLPFAEVPRLMELATRGGPVAYAVGGLVEVETPVGIVEVPATHAGQLDLPRLPTFRIAGARARLASLTEVDLEVTLLVGNENPFPLPEGELKYALALGGEVVATMDGEALGGVPARGEGRVVIPVRLSLLGAGRALATVVRGGSADLRMTGEARLGAMAVPLDLGGRATGR